MTIQIPFSKSEMLAALEICYEHQVVTGRDACHPKTFCLSTLENYRRAIEFCCQYIIILLFGPVSAQNFASQIGFLADCRSFYC